MIKKKIKINGMFVMCNVPDSLLINNDEMPLNLFEMWQRNWNNSYKFFKSKGNVNTKSRLKDKWRKEFERDMQRLIKEARSII